jgi:hypothetical protein
MKEDNDYSRYDIECVSSQLSLAQRLALSGGGARDCRTYRILEGLELMCSDKSLTRKGELVLELLLSGYRCGEEPEHPHQPSSVKQGLLRLEPVERRALLQLSKKSWTSRRMIRQWVRSETLENLLEVGLVEVIYRNELWGCRPPKRLVRRSYWRLTPFGASLKAEIVGET